MKWQGRPQSDNVEIDCLGKDVPLKSPEASAALRCQAEVGELRQNFIQNADSANPEAAWKHAIMLFSVNQSHDDKKATESGGTLGFLSGFSIFGGTADGKDSFETRTEKLAGYLDVYSGALTAKNGNIHGSTEVAAAK